MNTKARAKYKDWVSDWRWGKDRQGIILTLPALHLAWSHMCLYLPRSTGKELSRHMKLKRSEQFEVERAFEDQLIAVREGLAE